MSYRPIFAHGLTSLGRRVFRHNRIDAICLEKPVPTAIHSHYIASSQRSSPQAISHGFPSVHPVVTSASLLPNGALSMLYFPRFPLRPPCRRFRIAPSPRSSPQPISFPSTLSSLPYAIYHGFPSVHLLVASVSLLSNGPTLPKLFPTVSLPSTLSSLLSRSFGTELSPSYFPRFPPRPPSRRFHLAPSQRGSPQAISHDGFPSVHLVVASVSLLPHGALQAIFPTVSFPSIFVVASVSLLPNGALPMLFPMVSHLSSHPSTLCCFRIVSSQWSSPQAISHDFPSVHPVVASASLLQHGPRSSPKAISHASPPSTLLSLPYRSFPTELSPPCRRFRIAPFQRSSPHAISHGFPSSTLSSLPSRSFPTELSPSYFPRFPPSTLSSLPSRSFPTELSLYAISYGFIPSVHLLVASVSLLPNGALRKLFPTVSLLSTLSSLPYRSFPTELSPSYFPRFPLRPPCRRFHPFPPNGALPKLFPTVSRPSTLSSLPYRSLAASVTKREPKHRRCFWEKTCTERP